MDTQGAPWRLNNHAGHLISKLLVLVGLCSLTTGCGGDSAAAEDAQQETPTPAEEPADASLAVPLGKFHLRQARPLEGQTIDLKFELHAKITDENADDVQQFVTTHSARVREQIVLASRATETPEFQDPDLAKFRRRVYYRLLRLIPSAKIEDILISGFRWRSDR